MSPKYIKKRRHSIDSYESEPTRNESKTHAVNKLKISPNANESYVLFRSRIQRAFRQHRGQIIEKSSKYILKDEYR